MLTLPPSCETIIVSTSIHIAQTHPGITHINVPNLQRKPRVARTGAINKTTAFTTEVVRHVVAAQDSLGPVFEARLEDFESFLRVGDVVIVAEAVAGEVVFVGAVASELEGVRSAILGWVVEWVGGLP